MKDVFIGLRKLAEGIWEGHSLDRSVVVRAESRRSVERKMRELLKQSVGTSTRIRFLVENMKRVFGFAKGEFSVPDDFNGPLPKEIEALFY